MLVLETLPARMLREIYTNMKIWETLVTYPHTKLLDISRAGAKRRVKVVIPLGDLLHSGILTEHSGIQICPNSMSSTLDGN